MVMAVVPAAVVMMTVVGLGLGHGTCRDEQQGEECEDLFHKSDHARAQGSNASLRRERKYLERDQDAVNHAQNGTHEETHGPAAEDEHEEKADHAELVVDAQCVVGQQVPYQV